MTTEFADSPKVLLVALHRRCLLQFRLSLQNIGVFGIYRARTHTQALSRLQSHSFSHVIFDARPSDISPCEFVDTMVDAQPEVTLIACSEQPLVDDVFGLLRRGARGFLVPPCTSEIVENVFNLARENRIINSSILDNPDRSEAFTHIVSNNFSRFAASLGMLRSTRQGIGDLKNRRTELAVSIQLASWFMSGGGDELRDRLVESLVARARHKDSHTRLGLLRQKLLLEREAQKETPRFELDDSLP